MNGIGAVIWSAGATLGTTIGVVAQPALHIGYHSYSVLGLGLLDTAKNTAITFVAIALTQKAIEVIGTPLLSLSSPQNREFWKGCLETIQTFTGTMIGLKIVEVATGILLPKPVVVMLLVLNAIALRAISSQVAFQAETNRRLASVGWENENAEVVRKKAEAAEPEQSVEQPPQEQPQVQPPQREPQVLPTRALQVQRLVEFDANHSVWQTDDDLATARSRSLAIWNKKMQSKTTQEDLNVTRDAINGIGCRLFVQATNQEEETSDHVVRGGGLEKAQNLYTKLRATLIEKVPGLNQERIPAIVNFAISTLAPQFSEDSIALLMERNGQEMGGSLQQVSLNVLKTQAGETQEGENYIEIRSRYQIFVPGLLASSRGVEFITHKIFFSDNAEVSRFETMLEIEKIGLIAGPSPDPAEMLSALQG
jgi:hypothetical protein